MANQLFGNNLRTTLSLSTAPGSLSPAATGFTLVSGGGNNWPTPSAGDYTLVTLYEVNGLGVEVNHEVVRVTNRTADTFTIDTRDFEQANAGVGRSFPDVPANNPSGIVYAALRYTAYAAGNTLNKDDNLASLVSASTARVNLGLGNVDNTSNATERAATATLTNKTVALGANTVSGTLAQFNTAVTDADLASLAGAETLTNKTIAAATNTITTAASGNLTSTNLNAALAELQTDVDTRATTTALTTHTGAAAGAHAATAIANTPAGNLAATTVQAALNELQTDVDTRALDSGLTTANTNLANHLSDAADAHDASAISYLGNANLSATNVEAAIDELDTEKLALAGGTLTGAINEAQGADIASAGTVNLTTATGNYVHITGTTTITAITLAQGAERTVVFDGALTLTNGASLLLPTAANITTVAGDTAVFRGEASSVVRCVSYVRKNGTAIAGSALSYLSNAEYVTGTDTTKILNAAVARARNIVAGTSVTASGTSVDFTGIPSWVKRITVMFNGVSTSGTSHSIVQVGDSGGIENTGYTSTSFFINSTTAISISSTAGYIIYSDNATYSRTGLIQIVNISGGIWVCNGNIIVSTTQSAVAAGIKTLSSTIDRIRITTVNGTDTFDTGSINILYE